jgi:hypothetical protein
MKESTLFPTDSWDRNPPKLGHHPVSQGRCPNTAAGERQGHDDLLNLDRLLPCRHL